ncbi:sensor histidine kinase [Actinoallomurus rhizosphaericola]|uniref:sensor histidine kinase n=1 Tax=Actinoallomurus rhizosphaericola TaxID=2952536 RepID=UPI002091C15C|nr:sensor histidine kinase [Actinoallomurus rhizosphaericola]MCO5993674.1 sensor histidine kinase [Actinoallomurus rhizosphaericola]
MSGVRFVPGLRASAGQVFAGIGVRGSEERSLVRVVAAVAGTAWFFYAMLHGPGRPGLGTRPADLVLTIGVFAGVLSLTVGIVAYRRGRPYGHLFYTGSAIVGVVLYLLAPNRPGSALLFTACGFVSAQYPARRSVPTVVVAGFGIGLGIELQHRPLGDLWTIVGLVGMFAALRAARAQEAAKRTEQQNLVLAERAHIAREIHDILAHSLSAQLVHLEGARLLIVNGRSEEALDRVERARGLARSGLEETRRALATLRGDIPPTGEVLRELADEHRSIAEVRCEVTITGEPRELEPKAGLAIIRTAQEALTNARKHAPGADVAVDLRYLDRWCELEVRDTGGTGPGPLAATGSGYGLVGMRERAELIGGTLEAGPQEKGFRVLLRVPL